MVVGAVAVRGDVGGVEAGEMAGVEAEEVADGAETAVVTEPASPAD